MRNGATSADNRPNTWLITAAAVCAVGVLFAAGLVMATSGASPGSATASNSTALTARLSPPTTEPGVAHTVSTVVETQAVAAVRPSLVSLTVDRGKEVTTATGIVTESGGVIATMASAVAGATSVVTAAPGGTREPVTMVGTDPVSGLAVMRVATDLPVANFDLADLSGGSTAIAVSMTGNAHTPSPKPSSTKSTHPKSGSGASTGSRTGASVYAGTVISSGTALGVDAATTAFSSTAVDVPLGADNAGCALLNHQGQVAGILDTTKSTGSRTMAVFLPASLVLGVTRQLVAAGSVQRGWLGIDVSDTAAALVAAGGNTHGAVIDTVDSAGAAARAGLQVGDTIVAVDGEPVHSMAELRTRLYPDLPGATLMVTFIRSGVQITTPVVLGAVGPVAAASDLSP
jgi:S1-C subfamily serine protease